MNLRIVLILLFSLHTFVFSQRGWGEEAGYILSFPKSGNTWCRYIVEYLTKHPTRPTLHVYRMSQRDPINKPLGAYFNLGVDQRLSPYLKGHSGSHFRGTRFHLGEDKRLILILRDFKECFPRFLSSYEEIVDFLNDERSRYYNYCNNVDVYLRWEPSRRFLIYYEDLILNPEEVVEKLGEFLLVDRGIVENFIENYAWHKRNCVDLYEKHYRSYTKGGYTKYHSSKLTSTQKEELIELVKERCPQGQSLLERYFH